MPAWSLLFVPASLLLLVGLLMCVSWIEQRVLSPRALIVHTARSRNVDPEHVEAFIASHSKSLLEGLARRATTREAPVLEVAAEKH